MQGIKDIVITEDCASEDIRRARNGYFEDEEKERREVMATPI